MTVVRSALTCLVIAWATPVRADDAPSVRALLADPAQLATWLRDHDPAAAGAREKVEQQRELAQQARVLPNPQAQFAIGGLALAGGNKAAGMTGPSGLADTADFSFGVSELVEIGKRRPRREAADLRTREAGEGAVGALGDRVNDATTTLGKLAYAAAKRAIVVQNLEAARKLQASEQIRAEKQDLAGLDFARIQLDTEALDIELARADADLAVALASCSATLFATCSAEGLDETALDGAAPLPGALPDANRAITDRPEHQAQRFEASALEQDAELADHRRIPDPTFGLVYDYTRYQYGGNLPQTLAVSIAFPLPFFDRGNHDAAASRAGARAIAAQEQALIRAERGQAEALGAQLGALQGVLTRLEKESVPKTQKIVENTRKAFDLGQSGLAELLLAERQRRDLLAQVLDTRFDLFNVRVNIRQQLGLDDQAARNAGAHK
jgi:cobalt-zinc-cadmium efflux system outer membrane protein